MITIILAGATRLGVSRRAPHSRLSPPATLEPWPVALRERTTRVVLAVRARRNRPPAIRSFLRAPPLRPNIFGTVVLTDLPAHHVRMEIKP